MADPYSVVGTKVHVSNTIPATKDAAGFGSATLQWTEILPNIQSVQGGDESKAVTRGKSLQRGLGAILVGATDVGEITVSYSQDLDDPGLQLVKAAYLNNSKISMRVTMANGDIYYRWGIVRTNPFVVASNDSDNPEAIGSFVFVADIVADKSGSVIVPAP